MNSTPDWHTLPKWRREDSQPVNDWPRTAIFEYVCDEPCEELFGFACWARGFDLPTFDAWLTDLEDCREKNELLYIRHIAKHSGVDELSASLQRLIDRRQTVELALAVRPSVQRDQKLQTAIRAERRPDISRWIDKQLARDPYAKSPALWAVAPDWLTDQIGQERFSKRVTARRKARKTVASY